LDEHEGSISKKDIVCNIWHGVTVSEVRALQILSAGGDSGSRAAKASSVNGPGESTASGDGREPHKREYKKKQLLGAKDKESAVAVSVDEIT